jgi:hypothetical protein
MRSLIVAVGLAAFVSLFCSSSAHAQGGLVVALVDLHEATGSYLLQRDALLVEYSFADGELTALSEHDDWRVRQGAELLGVLRSHPALHEEIRTAAPAFDRAGRPRFDLPVMRDPDARPAVVERFLHAGESAPVRAALALSLIGLRGDWDTLQHHLLAEEEEAEVRLILVNSMRRAGLSAARAGFAMGLTDIDAQVRAEACRSVGWRTDGELWAKQLLAALDDEDSEVQAMAARALGWRQVYSAFPLLLPGLDHPSAEVRLHSLRALSRLDEESTRVLPALQELQRDADRRVSRLAQRLLTRRSP